MKTIIVAEIEKTLFLEFTPTPFNTPLWQYTLWVDAYSQTLPFMATTDSYPTEQIIFSSLIVDYNLYYQATSPDECRTVDGSFYAEGRFLYVHFEKHYPPFTHAVFQYGRLYGFTNTGVRLFNKNTYLPEVLSVPSLSEAVDPIEYAKMAFVSGSLKLSNKLAIFDSMQTVFGNACNIRYGRDTGEPSDLINLMKFYIESYTMTTEEATFSLKDRREMLSATFPTATFALSDYPNIKTDLVGELMQEAFGKCFGVPGVCINEEAGNVAKVFRFASKITSIDSVQVYRNEQWEAVTPTAIGNAAGTVTLSVADAHDSGTYTNGILDVKATGTFRSEANPGDIIKALNLECCGIAWNASNYDQDEFTSELSKIADVGIFMKEAKTVFEWIEQLQYGSNVGFEFMTQYGKNTARLDDPNRDALTLAISAEDVLDIDDVEVDYNAARYASSVKVFYAHDQKDDSWKNVKNEEFKKYVLNVHRVEKDYEIETLLTNAQDATNKAAILIDDQKDILPIYRGVKVAGIEWFSVRIWDIIYADLSKVGAKKKTRSGIEGTNRTTSAAAENEVSVAAAGDVVMVPWGLPEGEVLAARNFVGYQRCQVVNRTFDLSKGTVSFDLRQRPFSDVFEGVINDN